MCLMMMRNDVDFSYHGFEHEKEDTEVEVDEISGDAPAEVEQDLKLQVVAKEEVPADPTHRTPK